MKITRMLVAFIVLCVGTLSASAADAPTPWPKLHALVIPDDSALFHNGRFQDATGYVRLGAMLKSYAARGDAEAKLGLEWLQKDAHTRKRLLSSLGDYRAKLAAVEPKPITQLALLDRMVASIEKQALSKVLLHEGREDVRRWLAAMPAEPAPPSARPTAKEVEEARR